MKNLTRWEAIGIFVLFIIADKIFGWDSFLDNYLYTNFQITRVESVIIVIVIVLVWGLAKEIDKMNYKIDNK